MHNSVRNTLNKFSLDITNSIVIGSGILQVLGIRNSSDIDLVTDIETFNELKHNSDLIISGVTLQADGIEIFPNWFMTETNKSYSFSELVKNSIVIDGVRYITLEFLLEIKELWVATDKVPREKDINDIRLIKEYLNNAALVSS